MSVFLAKFLFFSRGQVRFDKKTYTMIFAFEVVRLSKRRYTKAMTTFSRLSRLSGGCQDGFNAFTESENYTCCQIPERIETLSLFTLLQFQFLLKSDDFVAVLCCLQEVHLLGCFLHLARGLCNELLHLRSCHVLYDGVGCHCRGRE